MGNEQEKNWSWWKGYHYGNDRIRTESLGTNEPDFWNGLADYASKRSKQIKRERLEALINQPDIING